jgi:hypothetical protein
MFDSFGDGWNGALITVYQNGIEVGQFGSGFVTGSTFVDSVDLCDGFITDIVLTTPGGWPTEIGLTVFDPNGDTASFYAQNFATAGGDTLGNFTASCAAAPLPCNDPTGLTATNNVGCDSVEVDWTSNSGGSIIEYGTTGFTPGTGTLTGIVTAPYVISGLTPGTSYDIYIADTCSNDTSDFVLLNTSTASGPMPVAAFNIDSAIVNNVYEIYVDASASANATSFSWNFGNGVSSSNIIDTVAYASNGSYTITLVASNACGSDTATFVTNANVGLVSNALQRSLNVYPNPASDEVHLTFTQMDAADAEIRVLDMQGREVLRYNEVQNGGQFRSSIDVSDFATGMYIIEVQSGSLNARRRISIR